MRPPRGSQETSKRHPRGPKRPQLHHENEHFLWEGCYFSSYPVACNMSPLGSRRGPALRASIRRRTPTVSDYGRRQGIILQSD